MEKPLTPTELAAEMAISLPYASQLLSGARKPSRKLAIRIYERLGLKMGPVANLSPSDIRQMKRLEGLAA